MTPSMDPATAGMLALLNVVDDEPTRFVFPPARAPRKLIVTYANELVWTQTTYLCEDVHPRKPNPGA